MSFDLVVRGGRVVTAAEVAEADVGVRDGRIAAVGEGLRGAETLDARGLVVLPGGIDAHCHIAQESATGLTTADDYASGGRSAALGGTTCVVPFAAQHRGMGVAETMALYRARAEACPIDHAQHLIVADPTEAALAEEIPAALAQGVTALKVFTAYPRMMLGDEQLLAVLRAAKAHGVPTMVHAENGAMIAHETRRLLAEGRVAPRHHADAHPRQAEVEAIGRMIALARLVDAPLMVVHVSTAEGARLVAEARAEGARVWGETCPQYLTLTAADLDRPGMEGAKFMCSPPPRTAADQAALWRRLRLGHLALWSSDHAPYRFDASGKLAHGHDAPFPQIANGLPGLAARLPILFSEGVAAGRIDLPAFAALSAGNAARLYGLRDKGAIRVGADADLAVWDPAAQRVLTLEAMGDAMDFTPYEGMRVTGWPIHVLSRGRPVVTGGRYVGAPGAGRPARVAAADLVGPW